jgi:hypothetical protein
MLKAMVDVDKASKDKSPSPELFSLIKAAATNLLGFGELWGSIKKKGHDEGFTEKELQEMLRPFLKEKLDSKKVWYLFHADEQKQRSHEQYQSRTNISTNDGKNVLSKPEEREQYNPEEEIKKIGEIRRAELQKQANEDDEDEDPKDLEIAFLKEQKAELEEALKKTQQFTPATQLESKPAVLDDDTVFEYLKDRAMKTGDIIDFGRVGSGALVQALAQYKNSFGVVELFGRIVKK